MARTVLIHMVLMVGLLLFAGCGKNPEKAKRQQYLRRLAMARHAYRQDKLEDAIILVRGAIEGYADDAEAYVLRGKIQFELNLNEKAIESVNHAIELDPAHGEALLDRGIYWLAVGEDERAHESIDKAYDIFAHRLNVMPREVHTKLNLAMIAHLRGNTQSALDQINLVLTTDRDSKAARELKNMLKESIRQSRPTHRAITF